MAPPGSYPIQRAEAALGLQSIGGPPWPPVAHDPDRWMAALGSLPLMYQPGERWLYNTSAQVLGVLLARAGGRDLESVLRERILDPLGMADTGFTVPAEQLGRLTTAYRPDPETGQLWRARRPRRQLVEQSHLVPRRQRLAGIDHRRLLVVRLDAAGRRRRPGRGRALAGDGRADDDGPPDPGPAAGLGAVSGRARRLGPGPGGAGRRRRPAAASVRDRLGRRQRHHLAIERPQRRHGHPVQPARPHITQCPSRWPWTSGPGSTPPLRPPDPGRSTQPRRSADVQPASTLSATTRRPLLLDAPPGQRAQGGAQRGQADRHGRRGSRREIHGGDQHRDVQDQCACYGMSVSHGSAPLVVGLPHSQPGRLESPVGATCEIAEHPDRRWRCGSERTHNPPSPTRQACGQPS